MSLPQTTPVPAALAIPPRMHCHVRQILSKAGTVDLPAGAGHQPAVADSLVPAHTATALNLLASNA